MSGTKRTLPAGAYDAAVAANNPSASNPLATIADVDQTTGWGNYVDTQYTIGSPFSLLASTDTIVPNNSSTGTLETQKPADVTSFVEVVPSGVSGLGYDHSKITGRNGDGIIITVDCKVTPTSAAATYIEFWFDIGAPVGELYRRILSFPKGSGNERPINFSVAGYTLNTWEANGATVYMRANGPCNVYDIRYLVTRTHKAY